MTPDLPGLGSSIAWIVQWIPIRPAPVLPALGFAPIIFSALNFIITKALIHWTP